MEMTPGSWPSPLSAAALTQARADLGPGTLAGGRAVWSVRRPDEGGRASLWAVAPGGVPEELTPGDYVRDRVHEYGAGAWAASSDVIVYSTFPDNGVWVLDAGARRPLVVASEGLRYGGLCIDAARGLVLAIREDHRESDLDCVNTLVVLRLSGENPEGGVVLASGADFYGAPAVSAAGQVAWMEWDHPNMPWDATRLMVGRLDGAAIVGVRQIAGTPTSAPCYPSWHEEELVFLDDVSGFWNFHALGADGAVRRLHDEAADFAWPAWAQGRPYQVLGDGRIACVRFGAGTAEGGVLAEGAFTRVVDGIARGIGGDAAAAVFLLGHVDRPDTLELWRDGETSVLAGAGPAPLAAEYVSVPQSLTWAGPQGEVQGWFYPPTNPGFRPGEGELPPLKVLSHGGPTGMAYPDFDLGTQYWTTRGWAVLDVNYGGSSGFGRAYRERLAGQWGVVDVRDCADGVRAVVAAGLADPRHVAIEGGSAGGFTTLAAMTSSDVFGAGHSLYGIGDLALLAAETHKFESRYLFGLLGGTPEEVPDVYRERSPINHLDALACPMLIQQGEDDRVVPPSQAVAMADAVRALGLPVALVIYPGEGHGFRKAENIVASIEAAASFFGQVFGFDVPGVPVLPIENLG